MSTPLTKLSRTDLHEIFKKVSCTNNGAEGVLTLDTQKPGPSIGIMACTHGNEPAGLAAFAYLMKHQAHLQCGTVHLILNNLQACQRYFEEADDLSFTAHYRFVDRDMNRVKPDDNTYEASRIKTLIAIYEELDFVIDLHSTSAPSDPMLIEVSTELPLLAIEGVNIVLRNLVPHLNAPPLVSLCKKAQAYVLETGSHEDNASLIIAQHAVIALLSQEGILPAQPSSETVKPDIYHIYHTVVFPDESYRLTELIPNLGHIEKNTVFAVSDADLPVLQTDRDAYAVMPPPRLKPVHPGSEFLYLSEKMQ